MAKKTPASTENSEDSAQDLQQSAKKTVMPQADAAPQADSTLPFAQPRDELINKFRANAVPREADYKQLLDQHYDVAGALGMAHAQDNGGDKTGNGLILGTSSKKLEVLAKPQGGLHVDTAGVRVEHDSSLTVGTDGLALNVDYNPVTQYNRVGEKGLTTNAQGQLSVSLNHNTGSDTVLDPLRAAGVIKADNGLSIHVGGRNDRMRKGLKTYKGDSYGNVLGVDHDSSLLIDGTGSLGVKLNSNGGLTSGASGIGIRVDPNKSIVVTDGKIQIKTHSDIINDFNGLRLNYKSMDSGLLFAKMIGASLTGNDQGYFLLVSGSQFLIINKIPSLWRKEFKPKMVYCDGTTSEMIIYDASNPFVSGCFRRSSDLHDVSPTDRVIVKFTETFTCNFKLSWI